MRLLAIIAVCTTVIASAALASPPPVPPELQCEFESYVSATAAEGSSHFIVEAHSKPGINSVRFTQISPIGRSAYAEGGNVNTNRNLIIVGEKSWIFSEGFPLSDNTYLTVVFIADEPEATEDKYRAVRSRQWTAEGAVYATQQYGYCKAIW